MPRDLPAGTVTFLFSDIAGSTKLLMTLGGSAYSELLAEHRRIMREAFLANGGVEVDTQGDAFFAVFSSPARALAAAAQARDGLAGGPIRVRIGLHTGTPHVTDEGYVGEDVHLGARIAASGHGGQVLLSKWTRDLLDDAFPLTDLGEHRVKDFARPVPIFQLGSDLFPPLRTISNTNLPRPASSFIGRQREVNEVTALLRNGARLVTLTGPGGSGKTRLAIEAAAELVPHFRSGVFWIALASLRDPALVSGAIAQTIGAKDTLAVHIGEREMLLLLDNFEQVVEAAPEAASLLASCPNLRLLVTTRELLRVNGEIRYDVPPLASADAVTLFCARSGLPGDAAVAALCRQLDDLPLAVELAAARTRVVSPVQIMERLSRRLDLLRGGRDAESRQRTLRATIEWSHELLTPEEQRLFARLAVFRGGWTLEAAEAVAEADVDTLQSLVEKSLVRRVDERFSMLETIHEYAAERLMASGESDERRRRHAEHFLGMAREAEPELFGPDREPWLDRLELDHDNIRAALEGLEGAGDTQRAMELASSIFEFWDLRSHQGEGGRRLDHLLSIDALPTRSRSKALIGSALLAWGSGVDPLAAKGRAAEAAVLARGLGDPWILALAEFEYAGSCCLGGDFASARPVFEESVRRFRDLGNEGRELYAMRLLAWACWELGDRERFKALNDEIVRRARAIGDREHTAFSLANLSEAATSEGRHADAIALLEEAYALDRAGGDPNAVDVFLVRFARALAFAEHPDAATSVLAAAEALHDDLDWTYPGWIIGRRDEALAKARAALDDVAFAAAWAAGRTLTPDAAVALAHAAVDQSG